MSTYFINFACASTRSPLPRHSLPEVVIWATPFDTLVLLRSGFNHSIDTEAVITPCSSTRTHLVDWSSFLTCAVEEVSLSSITVFSRLGSICRLTGCSDTCLLSSVQLPEAVKHHTLSLCRRLSVGEAVYNNQQCYESRDLSRSECLISTTTSKP